MNEILWWFGQNTLTAILVIPCVLLACRLFRDRPAVQHLLWLVILVKFVTPPIVAWPWGVDDVQSLLESQGSGTQITALDSMPAGPYPDTVEPDALPIEPLRIARESVPNPQPIDRAAGKPVFADIVSASPQPKQVRWSSIFTISALSVWLIGAIVCFAMQMRRLRRYASLVRGGVAAPSHVNEAVITVASRLRMKAPVCMVVKGIASPFLWCARPVRLVWPDSISSPDEVSHARGIIAHELAHLRRRDHWITWLELGASVLWWWNPLFWFVQRRLREAAEMSCDALAIATDPESRHDYAELLLQLSSQSADGVPTPVLAVGAGNVASFERRLKMILSSSVSGKLSWKGALALATFAVIALPCWSLSQSAANPPLTDDTSKPELVNEESSEEVAIQEAVIGDIRYLHPPAIAQSLIVKKDAWGPTVDGLKAAFLMSDIVVRSDNAMIVNGALVVKNVSKKPIRFSETASLAVPTLYDDAGKTLRIEPTMFSSLILGFRHNQNCTIVRRTILAPGEQCVLDRGCELAVYHPDRNEVRLWTRNESATVPSGKYSVVVDFTPGLRPESYWKDAVEQTNTALKKLNSPVTKSTPPDFYENGHVVPRSVPGEWYGSLQTGKVQFAAFNGSDVTKISESRKVRAAAADNLRVETRSGLSFFKRDGVLRMHYQHVPHALVAFVPANDGSFIAEGAHGARSTCSHNLLDISDNQVKLFDLCSGKLLAHFLPNEEGVLEQQK